MSETGKQPGLFVLPRRRPPRRPRLRGLSFNRMLPNLLTLVGLCVGFTAIRFALDQRFGAAVIAIAVAGAIDGLDGRLARLLKATSRFGAEFDSLSDFLCFGIAPALTLYLWSLDAWGAFGYLPALMFTACMALRLARFNAALDAMPHPPGAHLPPSRFSYNFFTGVPAPAGAALSLLPIYLGLESAEHRVVWLADLAHAPALSAVVLVGTALLCVSTIAVWSFKNFKVPPEYVLGLLLGIVLFAALLMADPWLGLALLAIAYLVMLPFSHRSFKRLQAEAEARLHPDQAPDGS
ncbi:phosphatidylcholine/phosphatidylserine synthase [Acidiphilium sp. AL]|uniref:Phosphatidylcholine/phosphatidylserine synthase n=1 Tax=Acidiphilium iwatense TaxID=768198 RepID=A0ABS9E0I7_9PROT|nr:MULTISPECIES: phosphatidylcholine/phosphatidylserine synthase [Acidiphilium]MCF3948525.1 phosphatidylcholine/phosphatidylserine synthase [Acidiphilium iwatense]MCU4160738.1 phosphatidylcholine/phosphatidylserine synthase [Acidiphilium sp. AL]